MKTFVVLLSVLLSWSVASGAPVTPPDLAICKPLQARDDLVVDCCLPTNVPTKDFVLPDPSEPLRIRKNAASLDEESIKKLQLAYERMRALPPDDPRSMHVQQDIHCGYCTEIYKMMNSSKTLEIHRNWLLLPFHRLYVYFHERILGSLIDDPTFAIPYWNWDNQSSTHFPYPNAIPEYYYEGALLDENRDSDHRPPKIPDLHWGPFFGDWVPPGSTQDEIRHLNKVCLHESIVVASRLPHLFLGGRYRFDEDLPYQPSLFEVSPHASIHGWVGDSQNPKGEDLTPAYSAARDPIFFSHHSNVDRLYNAWHAQGGFRRQFPEDRDWRDASFTFYDEKGEMVRVTVAQSLDNQALRYDFEPTEDCWKEDPTTPVSSPDSSTPGWRHWVATTVSKLGVPHILATSLLSDIPDVEAMPERKFSNSVFRSRVGRPHAKLAAAGKLGHLEEVLVIDRIWIPTKKPIWFDIFINLPEADENTRLDATEWSGRFTNAPHIDQAGHMEREAMFAVSIGPKLEKLGILHQESVVVTLVPRGPHRHEREVQIKTIRIELQ